MALSISFTIYNQSLFLYFFFFNDTATTEIYTLSLHDALPIWFTPPQVDWGLPVAIIGHGVRTRFFTTEDPIGRRSEEHTSELQSQSNLVCRLLLEKKKRREVSFSIVFTQSRKPSFLSYYIAMQ